MTMASPSETKPIAHQTKDRVVQSTEIDLLIDKSIRVTLYRVNHDVLTTCTRSLKTQIETENIRTSLM